MQTIALRGARTHHLKGVSLRLHPGQLVVVTGVSGSGKSSLAFDTLYAEGQRRFVESFSPYARQFLERLERPPMDSLDPVAAAIAVDRRAPIKSSRSTLATMADLEAYLGALFAREAKPCCPDCQVLAEHVDPQHAAREALSAYPAARAVVSYPAYVAGTESYLEAREILLRDGYRRLLVDGEVRDLDSLRPSEALAAGAAVDVVVDRLKLGPRSRNRLAGALEQAWKHGDGQAALHLFERDDEPPRRIATVRGLSCPDCGRAFSPASPGLFSYQSPVGACDDCRGFGRVPGIAWDKVVPDPTLCLGKKAIRPWSGRKASRERRLLRQYCEQEGISMELPWAELTERQREQVIEGHGSWSRRHYPGLRSWFKWLESKSYKMHVRVLLSRYRSYERCPSCCGKRLSAASLMYRVDGLDLGDWHGLELREARARLQALSVGPGQGELVVNELVRRLGYLERVGLGYLSLDRQARSLSGGEAQRVALTAALGTSLTGALFVLDEPTVGLHPTDLPPLIEAMRALAAAGNYVVVVEHDPVVIAAADRVIELGPAAGPLGGQVVFDGSPNELMDPKQGKQHLATARALAPVDVGGRRSATRARGELQLCGVEANNLHKLDVSIPLGVVVAVCGPSGSGKSTLVDQVLYRTLARSFGHKDIDTPGKLDALQGLDGVSEVVLVDQSPLGRTSRGNAATYSGAWTRIRALFAADPTAALRGFTPAHFSFNVSAGRCEACAGEGAETVQMQFLADVVLVCPVCQGKRFRPEVLEIVVDGLSIADVLALSVDEAIDTFELETSVFRALCPLKLLGLGYLPLGQPLSTLSGGEAQRLKLARALRKVSPAALFILDEPSAGLHADEIASLNKALRELVLQGASVVVVDHDPAVIAAADHAIELGPGAGREGGTIVAACSPAKLTRRPTRTGLVLAGHDYKSRLSHAPIARRGDNPPPEPSKPLAPSPREIEIVGAREHNLANIDVRIPHGKLVVVTGPSGSGKSSLAFDVVFAEGQRRFLETLSPYARQFLPTMPRPDVDRVSGVPPSVALEQRTARAGATSTVATVTEIAHYLRLLYAKLGTSHCPDCDLPVVTSSVDEVFARLRLLRGKRSLRAPVVKARKGTYLDVFSTADSAGVQWALVDGKVWPTDQPPKLARSKEHDIDLIVFEGSMRSFYRDHLERALRFGKGQAVLGGYPVEPHDSAADELLSTARACAECGRAVPELDPRWFSFNTTQGRCAACEGTGFRGGVRAVREHARAAEDKAKALQSCPRCEGARLAPIPRGVRLCGLRYHEHCALSVRRMRERVEAFGFAGEQARIAAAPVAELLRRLRFVEQVGLGYLSLDRRAQTLSGGEMQRLRLAAQLGAGLTGALYVLDEPTIGLHPRDTQRLLGNLRALVETGSTVLVVEHDADTIRAADELIDLGPAGGRGGGHIVAAGPPAQVLANPASPTAAALRDEGIVARARIHRASDQYPPICLDGVRANNLEIDRLELPSGCMVVVAGVSGSGKSTLVGQVLYPAARRKLGRTTFAPGAHEALRLPASVQRVIAVDQAPIGRTSRSVPATFLGVWDQVRRLFAGTPEARAQGFKPARFSFNSAAGGGRCPRCDGNGVIAHEMAFLPDVKTSCEACAGQRFEPATLQIRYRGLSIGDVLRLTVEEATEIFSAHQKITRPLQVLLELGVGYVQLGQGSHTLSGGEAQRLKLAVEMAAGRQHKPTLYVLDEPTTGLHHSDVARLIAVLDQLVQRGDSLVIIEHHPAVIAAADHLIELGPEGGEEGGRVVAQGTVESVAQADTATAHVLRRLAGARRVDR